MSEAHLSAQVADATRPTPTPLTTAIQVPPVNASEVLKASTPTPPTDLPPVVATKSPVVRGGPPEGAGKSQTLSSIPESSTEEVATAERTSSVTGDKSSDEPGADSDDEESFGTPDAKIQSLPSPELTNIPLSPTDASVTAASESSEVPASSALQPTGAPTSPVTPMQRNAPALALQSQHAVSASPDTLPTSPPSPSSSSVEVLSPAPLDSLLSPAETEGKFPIRDSVAASEATEDEARFSTVLLSARQSLAPSPQVIITTNELHTVEEGTGSDENTLVDDWRQHKKTASNSTILSATNVPYLLSKLSEAEEVDDETPSRVRPPSFQGTQAIKEEFYQRHEEEEARGQAEVDWGASCCYFCCWYACVTVLRLYVDFWGQVINDYQGFAAANPEKLAKAIERGIPSTLRGMIWQLMSASKDPKLEATYLRLLKEPSPHEKSIQRDLGRTFPHHAFFTDGHGIGQENLFNVLKAYSLYDPQVGYCQGLPFIVAILLLNMPDEEAFCLLVRLMHSYDVRGHFLPEMPRLQLRLFERLLEEVLPVLHLHFVRQGVKASMYCSQWFLTMFSYRFPMDIVFRIYDNCLASGIEAMFAFSMTLLSKNETTLLSMKFDQLIQFLNQRVFDIYQIGPVVPGQAPTDVRYHVDEFVQDSISLRITPFMLDNYAHEYEELVRARDAHKVEVENLRNTNTRLLAQMKTLESNMAQLNTDHCEVLNELVMARLRHEELESELVRYKLLYAEAMHQSEDAMSSHRISLVASKRGSNSSNRFG
ncbi:RabGAP/TBC [Ganoderma leucocontextum]|nr:RabGAP/TBC [Ganoderma leucocontextum]